MKKTIILVTVLLSFILLASGILSSCAKDPAVTTAGAGNKTDTTTSQIGVTTVPVVIDDPAFENAEKELDTYQNPLKGKDGVGGDLWGDPFMMRYDGKYYVYCSNHTNYVFCYESTDMVNWTDKGKCAYFPGESWFKDPYAPEVTYYNGKFYMVTSLSGGGHYVLVAENPWGPFEKASDNQGLSIDGHIFIDNDGKWYFYSASGSGIMCYEMTSPTKINQSGSTTGAIIDDGGGTWTEGPMVIYHDGIYYLTYTGNHVLSNTYRIDYATNSKTPTRFSAAKENPLLISADAKEPVHGIGHSSTVKGPDLDSYYIVYHAMHNKVGIRTLNIDRLYMNGTVLDVMGPTTGGAQISNMPDIYAQFDAASDSDKFDGVFTISDGAMTLGKDTIVLSKGSLDADTYTIELTTSKIGNSGKAGVIFGYKDENNYGSALFDSAAQKLIITFVVNGTKTENAIDLVKSFNENYNFAAVQSIQVENNKGAFTFYVNDRELYKTESTLGGGKIGVKTEGAGASFGYIGGIDEVGGSSAKEYYKPAAQQAGTYLAIHCLEKDVTLGSIKRTGEKYVIANAGQSLNYRLAAAEDGKYDLAISYSAQSDAVIEIYVNGKLFKEVALAATEDDSFMTAIIRGFEMTKGGNVITVYLKSGNASFFKMETAFSESVIEYTDEFAKAANKNLRYKDGLNWNVEDGVLVADGAGRRVYGDNNWGDYSFELDVTPNGSLISFGVLVRASELGLSTLVESDFSTKPTEGEVSSCLNWMEGYYVEFTAKFITVRKCNYSTAQKREAAYRLESGKTYHIKVECEGATLRVFVNNELVLEFTDPEPIIQGMPGIRVSRGNVAFDNLTVKKLNG